MVLNATMSTAAEATALSSSGSPTPSPMMSTAAPELVDYVIDFLHDDRDTLKACSLVCKAWGPAVSYHLFDSLELNPNDIYHHSNSQSPRPLHTILQTKPRISNAVRHVSIANYDMEPRALSEVNCEIMSTKTVAVDVLADMLATFPNISSISISPSLPLVPKASDKLTQWTSALTKPTALVFDQLSLVLNPAIVEPANLTEMASMFGSIKSMKVMSVLGNAKAVPRTNVLLAQQSAPRVKALILDFWLSGFMTPDLLCLLSYLAKFDSLEHLSLDMYSPAQCNCSGNDWLNHLLYMARNLTSFRFWLDIRQLREIVHSNLQSLEGPLKPLPSLTITSLAKLTSLCTIELSVSLCLTVDPDAHYTRNVTFDELISWQDQNILRLCIEQLAHLSPGTLRCILLEISPFFDGAERIPPAALPLAKGLSASWHVLAEVVERYPLLEKLELLLPKAPQAEWEEQEAIIKANFAPQKRSLLRFIRCYPAGYPFF